MFVLDQFVIPLSIFDNCMMYGNSKNDNRVTLSSALALPSFGENNEERLLNDIFNQEINHATNNKISIVAPCKDVHSLFANYSNYLKSYTNGNDNDNNDNTDDSQIKNFLEKYSNCWYKRLDTDIEWKRFLVVMNSNYLETKFAHTLLASPIYRYDGCKPVLKHLNEHFVW